ncbi:hypothetical protein CBS14141_003434 [Malassezia furfur]|nr:hypothetical protein CBS14141_003434 [Malassezia furfur]
MTSHLLSRLKRQDDQRKPGESCIFCSIIEGKEPAYILYETDECVAFLDILPIRAGHILVIPKDHVKNISDLSSSQSAALMQTVVAVAQIMEKAFGITGLQVAANQEYAQAVDHVHFHVVPAPLPDGSPSVLKKFDAPPTLAMLGRRDELTQEEGDELTSCFQKVLHRKAKL